VTRAVLLQPDPIWRDNAQGAEAAQGFDVYKNAYFGKINGGDGGVGGDLAVYALDGTELWRIAAASLNTWLQTATGWPLGAENPRAWTMTPVNGGTMFAVHVEMGTGSSRYEVMIVCDAPNPATYTPGTLPTLTTNWCYMVAGFFIWYPVGIREFLNSDGSSRMLLTEMWDSSVDGTWWWCWPSADQIRNNTLTGLYTNASAYTPPRVPVLLFLDTVTAYRRTTIPDLPQDGNLKYNYPWFVVPRTTTGPTTTNYICKYEDKYYMTLHNGWDNYATHEYLTYPDGAFFKLAFPIQTVAGHDMAGTIDQRVGIDLSLYTIQNASWLDSLGAAPVAPFTDIDVAVDGDPLTGTNAPAYCGQPYFQPDATDATKALVVFGKIDRNDYTATQGVRCLAAGVRAFDYDGATDLFTQVGEIAQGILIAQGDLGQTWNSEAGATNALYCAQAVPFVDAAGTIYFAGNNNSNPWVAKFGTVGDLYRPPATVDITYRSYPPRVLT
jgi:hypothetical protein